MSDSPHQPAAFINAIAEDRDFDEAIRWLQKTWNDLCAKERELSAALAKKEDGEPVAWISVEDRLPVNNGRNVLAWRADNKCSYTACLRDGKWTHFHGSDDLFGITHWMPLPAAPDAQPLPVDNSKEREFFRTAPNPPDAPPRAVDNNAGEEGERANYLIKLMAEDGWLYHGPEGMDETQQAVSDYYADAKLGELSDKGIPLRVPSAQSAAERQLQAEQTAWDAVIGCCYDELKKALGRDIECPAYIPDAIKELSDRVASAERRAKEIRQETIEECAKVCDKAADRKGVTNDLWWRGHFTGAKECVVTIRALKP